MNTERGKSACKREVEGGMRRTGENRGLMHKLVRDGQATLKATLKVINADRSLAPKLQSGSNLCRRPKSGPQLLDMTPEHKRSTPQKRQPM